MIGAASWRDRRALVSIAAAGLAVAAAAALGWHSGQAAPPTSGRSAPAGWSLPQEAGADPAHDAAVLRARHPWGGGASFRDIDAAPPAPAAQPWTFVGTVLRDGHRYALIRTGPPTATLDYRVVGDKLPDGSRLDTIDADSITTLGGAGHGEAPIVYRLFKKRS